MDPSLLLLGKRTYEAAAYDAAAAGMGMGMVVPMSGAYGNDPKRPRPEEILGSGQQAVTRVLMTRQIFGKVIGKAGSMISSIRQSCGAALKGLDIDADNRLVVISGTLKQVLDGFEKVSELMVSAYSQQAQPEPFMVHLLIEHDKVGRVIGPKGATMQGMKLRSGATQVRVQKDPRDFCGVLMRVVTMEGNALTVRKAHFCLQEVFLPDAAQMIGMPEGSGSSGHNFGGSGSSFLGQDSSYFGGSGGNSAASRGGGGGVLSIPLHGLPAYGVPNEVVETLLELKALFASQFGLVLDLSITRSASAADASQASSAASALSVLSVPAGASAAGRIHTVPYSEQLLTPGVAVETDDMLVFSIPKSTAGVVIGKGGQALKELQKDFGVHVFVEKEVAELPGLRAVVLKCGSDQTLTDVEKAAMRECQTHILALVASEQEKERQQLLQAQAQQVLQQQLILEQQQQQHGAGGEGRMDEGGGEESIALLPPDFDDDEDDDEE